MPPGPVSSFQQPTAGPVPPRYEPPVRADLFVHTQLSPTTTSKKFDKWKTPIAEFLGDQEMVWAVARASRGLPVVDALVITSARVFSCFAAEVGRRGPVVDLTAADIANVILQRSRGGARSKLLISSRDGEQHFVGWIDKQDVGFVSHYLGCRFGPARTDTVPNTPVVTSEDAPPARHGLGRFLRFLLHVATWCVIAFCVLGVLVGVTSGLPGMAAFYGVVAAIALGLWLIWRTRHRRKEREQAQAAIAARADAQNDAYLADDAYGIYGTASPTPEE